VAALPPTEFGNEGCSQIGEERHGRRKEQYYGDKGFFLIPRDSAEKENVRLLQQPDQQGVVFVAALQKIS
jgi:hypothetical protein